MTYHPDIARNYPQHGRHRMLEQMYVTVIMLLNSRTERHIQYGKKLPYSTQVRIIPESSEVSISDRPCIPSANPEDGDCWLITVHKVGQHQISDPDMVVQVGDQIILHAALAKRVLTPHLA